MKLKDFFQNAARKAMQSIDVDKIAEEAFSKSCKRMGIEETCRDTNGRGIEPKENKQMEIIGFNMTKFMQEHEIHAKKTYTGKSVEVWEIEPQDEALFTSVNDEFSEDEWRETYPRSWWRSAHGCNMDKNPVVKFIVNGQEMNAYEGSLRDDLQAYYKDYCQDITAHGEFAESFDEWVKTVASQHRADLTDLLSCEYGANMGKNVCAICVDLARINNMKMSELFEKYGESFVF